MNYYDLIIVGGGIAGLRVGINSLKKYPHLSCCIIEKYNYIGGRIVTFHKDIPGIGKVQWENGAGRISTKHKKVLSLMKEYDLTFIPISSETDFIKEYQPIETNTFSELCNIYLKPLQNIPIDILKKYTLKQILDKILGPSRAKEFYIQFPYYSEIHTLRSDIALHAFNNEMSSNKDFGICKEGLSNITDYMKQEFIRLGGNIILNMELNKVESIPNKSILLTCTIPDKFITRKFIAQSCVLALHHAALKNIIGIKQLPVLKYLKMMPLLRIYAIFPVKKRVSWFSGLNKIVTNSIIRYIIPIDSSRGIIMISYTDGNDASFWFKQKEAGKKLGNENVQDLVMTEIRKLFPERHIPDPLFFKQHPWYDGCTYWLPGNYDVEEESNKSLHPMSETMPHLFMCGESFAVNQCWIESALDQADKLIQHKKFVDCLLKLHNADNK